MLRLPPDSSSVQPPSLQQSPSHRQYGPLDNKRPVRHTLLTDRSSSVPSAEKRRIYDEWTRAGKPHNLICSQCRKPDDLIPCETCCRSYHTGCLQMIGSLSPLSESFHCPSCRRNQWDRSLQFESPLQSSNASRSSTPSANGPSRVTSPSGYMTTDQRASLEMSRSAILPHNLRLPDDSIPEPSFTSQARDFLMNHGRFPANQEFPPDLLSRLGSMMAALEAQRSLQDEIQNLRAENANLRNDNANMRDYFNSNLPTREPMIAAQSSDISADTPKTTTDTGEKAWDRIMYDII